MQAAQGTYNRSTLEQLTGTIVNVVETTTATIVKIWDDADNQDGKRPESVTIKITGSDGNEYTVKTDADWNWSVADLPKYAVGKVGEEVTYTVTEITVDGYTCEIVKNEDGTYTVTNTHTPEVISISGKKIWDDKDNKDGIRPGSITVKITGSDGKEYTATTDADWNWIIKDLPKYADGVEIEYTVSELSIDGYTCAIAKNEDGSYTITNTHTPKDDPAP